ncbi:hypothetical protein [Leifsonia lichenia]
MTDIAVVTVARMVLSAVAGMQVRVMAIAATAPRVTVTGVTALRARVVRVVAIRVTVLSGTGLRATDTAVTALRARAGTVGARRVTASVPGATAATVVPVLPALVVRAMGIGVTVTVTALRVRVLRVTDTAVTVRRVTASVPGATAATAVPALPALVVRAMGIGVTALRARVLRVRVVRATDTVERVRGTGSGAVLLLVGVGAHPVATTGTAADAAMVATVAMDGTEVAATSCGPGTVDQHAATVTRGTTSGSSPKKSAWRASCGRFARGMTTRRFPSRCRRATSTRVRALS